MYYSTCPFVAYCWVIKIFPTQSCMVSAYNTLGSILYFFWGLPSVSWSSGDPVVSLKNIGICVDRFWISSLQSWEKNTIVYIHLLTWATVCTIDQKTANKSKTKLLKQRRNEIDGFLKLCSIFKFPTEFWNMVWFALCNSFYPQF